MSDLNKMISGEIYNPSDETLSQMRGKLPLNIIGRAQSKNTKI
jgi:Maltose acetyltransferase.